MEKFKNNALMLRESSNSSDMLNKKHKRNEKSKTTGKPWTPYSKMSYEDRKKLLDKESTRDQHKHHVTLY